MSRNLKRRVDRLETARGGGEVTLAEMLLWSYANRPYDAETQRRHDDFVRRSQHSKLCRLIVSAWKEAPRFPLGGG
jgi:hypothetical protein